MPTLSRDDDDVFLLDLGDDANRMSPDWLASVAGALDEVEAAPPPRALVATARGKTWSQGLDLEWPTGACSACPRSIWRCPSPRA